MKVNRVTAYIELGALAILGLVKALAWRHANLPGYFSISTIVTGMAVAMVAGAGIYGVRWVMLHGQIANLQQSNERLRDLIDTNERIYIEVREDRDALRKATEYARQAESDAIAHAFRIECDKVHADVIPTYVHSDVVTVNAPATGGSGAH